MFGTMYLANDAIINNTADLLDLLAWCVSIFWNQGTVTLTFLSGDMWLFDTNVAIELQARMIILMDYGEHPVSSSSCQE